MHGALTCPSFIGDSANIKAGDTWLSTELPRIIEYTQPHDAIIFITWDEGDSSNLIPVPRHRQARQGRHHVDRDL